MYNRYIRNDNGVYTRIPEQEEGERPRGGAASGNGTGQGQSGPQGASGNGTGQGRGERPRDESARPGGAEGREEPFRREGGGSWERRQPSGGGTDGLTGFLRHLLDQFHLDGVDTGDLLLLGLLFLLFREDADEELLVALGLLLIL